MVYIAEASYQNNYDKHVLLRALASYISHIVTFYHHFTIISSLRMRSFRVSFLCLSSRVVLNIVCELRCVESLTNNGN